MVSHPSRTVSVHRYLINLFLTFKTQSRICTFRVIDRITIWTKSNNLRMSHLTVLEICSIYRDSRNQSHLINWIIHSEWMGDLLM